MIDADGTIRHPTGLVPDIAGAVLSEAGLAMLRGLDPAMLPEVAHGTRLGAPVGGIGKYVCIGMNYADHVAQAGIETPKEPPVFMKLTSAISGPNDPIVLPRGADQIDWEVELAVIIRARASDVRPGTALDHVAGYAVTNDVSERRFQNARGGEMTKGKSADTFAPLGPWLVTRDEVPDPQNLSLWLTLDGAEMQNGSNRTMIFPVAEVVAHLSQFMTLEPGDVIATGTPPGVGMRRTPPRCLKLGEVVALGVEGLGQLRLDVVARA